MHVHISVGKSMERKRVKNVVRTRVRYTLVFEIKENIRYGLLVCGHTLLYELRTDLI